MARIVSLPLKAVLSVERSIEKLNLQPWSQDVQYVAQRSCLDLLRIAPSKYARVCRFQVLEVTRPLLQHVLCHSGLDNGKSCQPRCLLPGRHTARGILEHASSALDQLDGSHGATLSARRMIAKIKLEIRKW